MTKARRATLEVLRQADQPLSATEIAQRIQITCDTVTIYRTLHYLEEHGYAGSFVLHCTEHGTERYYTEAKAEGDSRAHHHWFHCETCHTFIDLGSCRIKNLLAGYQEELGITVTSHTLYLTGTCPSCTNGSGNREEHHKGCDNPDTQHTAEDDNLHKRELDAVEGHHDHHGKEREGHREQLDEQNSG